jgi:hypothetical protein
MGTAALALALGACKAEGGDSGTAVGNPGKLTVVFDGMAAMGARSAPLPVDALVAFGCDGDEAGDDLIAAGVTLDTLEGATLLVPPGEYCGLGLLTDDDLVVDGTLSDARSYSVALPLGDLIVWNDGGFSVGEDEEVLLWIGAGGAFDEEYLELEAGDPIALGPEDETAQLIAEVVLDMTVLIDEDGEAVLAAVRPELWELDTLDEDDSGDAGEATACGGGAAAGVLLPGFLLMGLRRRRR